MPSADLKQLFASCGLRFSFSRNGQSKLLHHNRHGLTRKWSLRLRAASHRFLGSNFAITYFAALFNDSKNVRSKRTETSVKTLEISLNNPSERGKGYAISWQGDHAKAFGFIYTFQSGRHLLGYIMSTDWSRKPFLSIIFRSSLSAPLTLTYVAYL